MPAGFNLAALRRADAYDYAERIHAMTSSTFTGTEEVVILGESSVLLDLMEQTSRMAAVDKPVLIVGERGTGKELIASRLHYLSSRWQGPLVKLNCAALNESLLETELFGHEEGAFTGATRRHAGRFEQAHGGTLFLDELATVSLRVQEKILRAVEYGQFERVGGKDTLTVDARIVGATNQDLPEAVRNGKFHADLLDRLAFEVLTVPPLRARARDILHLAEHFAIGMCRELGRQVFPGFTVGARTALMQYPWPGNVRELKNVIERSVYRNPDDQLVDVINFDPFASAFRPLSDSPNAENPFEANPVPVKCAVALPCDLKGEVAGLEIELIERALIEARHNQVEAAQLLGLSYHQLRALLRKHNLVKHRGT